MFFHVLDACYGTGMMAPKSSFFCGMLLTVVEELYSLPHPTPDSEKNSRLTVRTKPDTYRTPWPKYSTNTIYAPDPTDTIG